VKELTFNYTSEGAHVMGVAAAPDGTICGGTAFPMRFFSYDPRTDQWTNRAAYSQWNTVARQGDRFFVGGYPTAFCWSGPARPWVATEKGNRESNPLFLIECLPTSTAHTNCSPTRTARRSSSRGRRLRLHGRRPADLEPRDEGAHAAQAHRPPARAFDPEPRGPAGGPAAGRLDDQPGTGGEQKAKQAELYILDMATKKIEWHEPVFPGVQGYSDLCPGPTASSTAWLTCTGSSCSILGAQGHPRAGYRR